jgi:general secretion pathway protein D
VRAIHTLAHYANRALLAILLLCITGAIGSCDKWAGGLAEFGPNARPRNATDMVHSLDLLPQQPQQVGLNDTNTGRDLQAKVFPASSTAKENDAAAPAQGAVASSDGGGYQLNFENAPIANVAKVILGDILGVGYTIDPRVRGTVSLNSGRPVPKSDLLFVLESALRVSRVALIHNSGGYQLVPGNEAIGSGGVSTAENTQPGYGLSVVPLRYVSAATLIKLLENFATAPGSVRAIPNRNLLLIRGSGPERQSAVQTVLSFDTDWMRGQSVGIYPIHNSAPEPMIAEIQKIIDSGEGGLSHDLVQLQAIARLNAIMVVTQKPALLKVVKTWIARLDYSQVENTGVKVYHVRYGDARQIAQILTQMFGGGTTTQFESATNQIAPGAGVVTSSSGAASTKLTPVEQLTGGRPPSASPQTTPSSTANSTSNALAGGNLSSAGATTLPNVRITADTANNSLLVFANQEEYQIIEKALRQIDRPQLQVAINSTIAEVTLNHSLAYGVQFYLKSQNLGLPSDTGSAVNTIGTEALSRVLPGFNILVGKEAFPQVILNELHQVTDVNILSNPSLVVVDNGTATLQVGDQVPITTGTATVLSANDAVVNTINYQNTGIILHIVPHINYNGTVKLDVEQEISNVSDTNNTGTLTPTISERKIQSTLIVADGQTVLLAGLVSQNHSNTHSGIPVLDEIPGIGDVFSQQNKSIVRTELIIFIRPTIIRDNLDAHLVAEELRSKMNGKIGDGRDIHNFRMPFAVR